MEAGGVLKDRRWDLRRDEDIECEAPDGFWARGDAVGAGVFVKAFGSDVEMVEWGYD